MSISVAPAATLSSISRTFVSMLVRPAGKPVDTAAMGKRPWMTLTAGWIISWYTHTAPVLKSVRPSASIRSARSGRMAFMHRRSTRPGVSSPPRVVRSIIWMAFTSQAAWYSFFTVRRFARLAARRSVAARLTRIWLIQPRSRPTASLRLNSGCMSVITSWFH
ncbi:hypothetical protein D3C72_1731250 [compost metagenome]